MGPVCDHVDNKSLGQIQQQVLATTNKTQFQQIQLQDNSHFKDKVQSIANNNLNFSNFAQGRKAYKHKVKDLYYLGDWSQADYQQGKGIVYCPDQYTFFGDFDSCPHGHGVLESHKQSYIYQGNFNHGKIEGEGKVHSTQNRFNTFSFEGTFNNMSQPSTGTLVVNNRNDEEKSYTVTLNNYPENKARITYKEGRQYEGDINCTRFVPHGVGTARYNNNSIYSGEWEDGDFHGKGVFTWADGSRYQGEYCHGKKHGSGSFTYPSRKTYVGEWRDGKQEGRGTLSDSQSNILKQGNWVNGKFVLAEE